VASPSEQERDDIVEAMEIYLGPLVAEKAERYGVSTCVMLECMNKALLYIHAAVHHPPPGNPAWN
jgi:hypothetical protein